MLYMNDYDLHFARQRFSRGDTPNRLALVLVVDNLREETNAVSDGWAHWGLPCRAAKAAQEHIVSRTNHENDEQERTDITEAEMQKALRPIKAFLTRQKDVFTPGARERILRAVES